MLQDDQLGVLRRQPLDGPPQVQVRLRCVGIHAHDRHDSALQSRARSRSLLEAAIAQEHVEPGIERPRGVERAQVAERVHERLLRGVSRIGVVACQEPRVGQRPSLVSVDQVSKGVQIARTARANRRGVIHLPLLSAKQPDYSDA